MTRVLTLESFRRPPPAPPPGFDEHDLGVARAEGYAEGRLQAAEDAATDLRDAIASLATALAADQARVAALNRAWRSQLVAIAQAIARSLAGPLRADALATQVAGALQAARDADGPPPARIRCEAAAAPALRTLLAAEGITGLTVEASGTGASFTLGEGVIRIDPDRVEAMLNQIIAEIGATGEDEG